MNDDWGVRHNVVGIGMLVVIWLGAAIGMWRLLLWLMDVYVFPGGSLPSD